jgi:hypothetical protein
MTREEAIKILKEIIEEGWLISDFEKCTAIDACEMAIKALEQEPILDKIFCIVHPLSIMSTPELEHKAVMQIAEMLEPLCLLESEE